MGLGTQMIAWHEDFCRELAERGLHVVRFDNRDIGRSTHLSGPPPTIAQLLRRSRTPRATRSPTWPRTPPGCCGELELAPAHVIGASMGGMIAQTLAARHPAARALARLDHVEHRQPRRAASRRCASTPILLRRAPPGREAFIEHIERVFAAIGSPRLPRDLEEIRELAAAQLRPRPRPGRPRAPARGDHRLGRPHAAELRRITAPTLVIHGTADPLVASRAGARPRARSPARS